MAVTRWIALSLVVACGHPTAVVPPRPPRPPAIAWFATADLVTFDGKDITAFSLAGGRVTRVGSTAMADDVITGGWVDRDRLIVELDGRRVVQVTPEGASSIAVPPRAAFARPSPQPEATDLVQGAADGLIVGDEGTAWWSECTWGWPYDGFQCMSHVSARLWPPGEQWVEGGEDPMDAYEYPWVNAVPAGYHVTAAGKKLACESPTGRTELSAGDDSTEQVYGFHWVSASPPRLLVVYARFGYKDLVADLWMLYDGCTAQPLEQGDNVEPGPGDLWLATKPLPHDEERRELRRGAVVIGDPPGGGIELRPNASR